MNVNLIKMIPGFSNHSNKKITKCISSSDICIFYSSNLMFSTLKNNPKPSLNSIGKYPSPLNLKRKFEKV